nr:hypothetical protein [Tanacetum cinerariifolium]
WRRVAGVGIRWWGRRVRESEIIDRGEGNKFGFAGKSPPEKFSAAEVVAGWPEMGEKKRLWWVYGGVGVGGSGGSGVRWRVGESGVDDWIDRSEGNKFGFAGKSPPEKFSAAAVVAGWPEMGEKKVARPDSMSDELVIAEMAKNIVDRPIEIDKSHLCEPKGLNDHLILTYLVNPRHTGDNNQDFVQLVMESAENDLGRCPSHPLRWEGEGSLLKADFGLYL